MTEYTYCPAEGCVSLVGLVRMDEGIGVNFCCANCWEWAWAEMSGAPLALDHPKHSRQCLHRQDIRATQTPVELPEGTVLIVMGKQHKDALATLKEQRRQELRDAPVHPVL